MARGWASVAARQHGVLSREQALGCGLSRKQVAGLLGRGEWVRVYPSVYRAAAAPVRWPQAQMATFLWAGGQAAVSHQAAAALWELEGFWRSRLELCGRAALNPPEGVAFHRVGRLAQADLSSRWSMRVTSVARTLLDLAACVPERTLERALDEALRKHLVTVPQVQGCIERNGRRGRQGVAHLAELLADRADDQPTDSGLETDVAAVLRQHRLPPPVRGHRVLERGRFLAQVDLAWPRQRVAVQTHGGNIHRQPRTWEKDQDTENLLLANGWFVVKATRRMVEDSPARLAALVSGALAARAVAGPPTRAG